MKNFAIVAAIAAALVILLLVGQSSRQTIIITAPAPQAPVAGPDTAAPQLPPIGSTNVAPEDIGPPAAATAAPSNVQAELRPPAKDNTADRVYVFGTVTSAADGTPIEGARVTLCSLDWSTGEPTTRIHGEATTNSAGEYELYASRGELMDPSWRALRAEAEGFASSQWYDSAWTTANIAHRHDFSLGAEALVSGQVVDEKGAPIAGARIGSLWLVGKTADSVDKDLYNTLLGPSWGATATSEEDGAFVLRGLEPGSSFHFLFRATGFLPKYAHDVTAGTENLAVILEKGTATLRIFVTNADGTPAAFADAFLSYDRTEFSAQPTDGVQRAWDNRLVATDADGFALVEGIEPGKRSVVAIMRPIGTTTEIFSDEQVLTLAENETQEVRLRLHEPSPVIFRFLDIDTNLPVRTAGVKQGGQTQGILRADESGEVHFETGMSTHANHFFIFIDIPPGYKVASSPSRNDGIQFQRDYVLCSPKALQSIGEKPPVITVPLVKEALLRLRILDVDGTTPAARARAGYFPVDAADKDGIVEISGQPGERVSVPCRNDRGIAFYSGVFPTQSVIDPIDVFLKPAASISGTVHDDAGSIVSNVRLQAFLQTGGGSGLGISDSKSLSTGEYKIENLYPGEYNIHLADGQGYAAEPVTVHVEGGALVEGVNLVLKRLGSISGAVFDPEGEPIAGVVVSHEHGMARTKTAADGTFSIEQPRDRSGIKFSHDSYSTALLRAEKLRQDEGIVILYPKAELRIAFQKKDGELIKQYRYSVGKPWTQGGIAGKTNAEDGWTVLTDIDAGEYEIKLKSTDPDQMFGGSAFVIIPQSEASKSVIVSAELMKVIPGKTVAAESPAIPVPNARIEFVNRNRDVSHIYSDEEGNFSIQVPGPSTILLSAETEDRAIKSQHFNPWSEVLFVAMPRKATIRGTIRIPESVAMNDVTVKLRDETILLQRDGTFQRRIAPGLVRIHAFTHLGLSAVKELHLKPGAEEHVELDLTQLVKLTGRITVNGFPWNGTPDLRIGSHVTRSIVALPDGRYEVELSPGQYRLFAISSSLSYQFQTGEISEAAGPVEQDFNLNMAPATVIFHGGDPHSDKRLFFPIVVDGKDAGHLGLFAGKNNFEFFPVGEFSISPREHGGHCETTIITPGGKNVIEVFMPEIGD